MYNWKVKGVLGNGHVCIVMSCSRRHREFQSRPASYVIVTGIWFNANAHFFKNLSISCICCCKLHGGTRRFIWIADWRLKTCSPSCSSTTWIQHSRQLNFRSLLAFSNRLRRLLWLQFVDGEDQRPLGEAQGGEKVRLLKIEIIMFTLYGWSW